VLLHWWLHHHEDWFWISPGLMIVSPSRWPHLHDDCQTKWWVILHCVVYHRNNWSRTCWFISVPILIAIVNGYVVVVHLMLRTLFGKLLMIYSILSICLNVSFVTKALMMVLQIGRQLLACHFFTIRVMICAVGSDVSGTCILLCFVHIFYCNNKLQRISKEESRRVKQTLNWFISSTGNV